MKKPSLKRKKKTPTPQQQAVPVAAAKKSRLGRKKAKSPQELGAVPAPSKKSRRKSEKALTPQQQAASSAGGGKQERARNPFGKLGARARIIVFALLAVVVVFAVLQLSGGRDDDGEVRAALERYEKASRDKDFQTLCDDLLASSYVKQTASSGLPCEVALSTGLEDVRNPTLEVLGVEVTGDRAAARVRGTAAGQVPGETNFTLVREDDAWRILPPAPASSSAAP